MKNLLLSVLMLIKKATCGAIEALFCRTMGHRPYICWVAPTEENEKNWPPRVRTFCIRCQQPMIWTYNRKKRLYELSEENS